MKECVLDLQSCSMRDSLVFSSISKQTQWQPRTADQRLHDYSPYNLPRHREQYYISRSALYWSNEPCSQTPTTHCCKIWRLQTERTGTTSKQTTQRNELWIEWMINSLARFWTDTKYYSRSGNNTYRMEKKAVISVDKLYIDANYILTEIKLLGYSHHPLHIWLLPFMSLLI